MQVDCYYFINKEVSKMLNNPLKGFLNRLASRRRLRMYGFFDGYGFCIERKIGKLNVAIISTELQQLPENYLNAIISIVEKNSTNSLKDNNDVACQVARQIVETGELIKSVDLFVSTKAFKPKWIIWLNPTNLPYY